MDSTRINCAKKTIQENRLSGKIIPFCNGKGNSNYYISRFVSLITPQYIGITAKQIGFIKRKVNLNQVN